MDTKSIASSLFSGKMFAESGPSCIVFQIMLENQSLECEIKQNVKTVNLFYKN